MSALWNNKLKLDAVPNREQLEVPSYQDINKDDDNRVPPAQQSSGGQVGSSGPFEVTPELFQVRILMNVGIVMDRGAAASTTVHWSNIVQTLQNRALRKTLQKLSPAQTLPASVKIVSATVGDSDSYRNMCHVKVFDHGKEKTMNTAQLYKGAQTKCEEVGYPLHLLTEEGGFVLEEPPQLTDTFKHYWYISKSMLTCCSYRQESQHGTYISIPKNSEAARLMYYVLVVKNGAMAPSDQNVTQLDNPGFIQEVSKLLADKLQDVRSKSFNCESITVELACFDVFRELMAAKGKVPAVLTVEVELHLPSSKDALDTSETPRTIREADYADFDD